MVNLSGRFLKDRKVVLASPISKLCSFPIKCSKYSLECQIAKVKPLTKKSQK